MVDNRLIVQKHYNSPSCCPACLAGQLKWHSRTHTTLCVTPSVGGGNCKPQLETIFHHQLQKILVQNIFSRKHFGEIFPNFSDILGKIIIITDMAIFAEILTDYI